MVLKGEGEREGVRKLMEKYKGKHKTWRKDD